MILFHKKIIISPLTTHLEVKKISKVISNKKFLYNQIYNLNKSLQLDFNIKKPKLVISGLNQHAGENGQLGMEEIKIIHPVIRKLVKEGNTGEEIINDGIIQTDTFINGMNQTLYSMLSEQPKTLMRHSLRISSHSKK